MVPFYPKSPCATTTRGTTSHVICPAHTLVYLTSIDVLYRDRGRREAPCGANESQWVGHWERDVDDTDWDVYYARDRSPEY